MTTKLKIPSVLAYSRSISPSIGLMYSEITEGNQTKELEIILQEEKLRGVISDYSTRGKADKNIGNPNLQTIDVARLNAKSDTLIVRANVLFLANSKEPVLHNDKDRKFIDAIDEFTEEFERLGGYSELARLYYQNIKSGSWLWRNKTLALQNIEVNIQMYQENNESQLELISITDEEAINSIAKAFTAKDKKPFNIFLTAKIKTGFGQEVYPSQEFGEDEKSKKDLYAKSRVLAKLNSGQAYIHSQKIGNAIRTIDTWYNKNANERPIAIEPLGVNQAIQASLRDKNDDLYHYLETIDAITKTLKDTQKLTEGAKFIAACLIRGGVYGGAGKNQNKDEGLNNDKNSDKDLVGTIDSSNG